MSKELQQVPAKQRAKMASNRYGVSRATIWNYARRGLTTPIKVTAGCTVFDTAELEAFSNGGERMNEAR